ncbi:hypothetical protein DP939_13625 [Spongiactinospora rosea]|uniref:CHAT domain-containing protein n=1 Tax=Spongiactinospora rosea TaxID=2248750 RepID=A0A366M2D5_9ACTN|nr:hypothetical protein DP939_13625 [Spongiactinospora rosea]
MLAAAWRAVVESAVDPVVSRWRAGEVLAVTQGEGDLAARVVARRALALAARELGDLPLAEEELRRAVQEGAAAAPQPTAQARLSLVTVLTELGRPAQALEVADAAEPYLCRAERAKLDTQRAVALSRLGRFGEAVRCCDHAVRVLTPPAGPTAGTGEDDLRFLAGALLNRGITAAYLGDPRAAQDDLERCAELAATVGLGHVTALARANLPFVAARRGDIGGAFAHYRDAEEALAAYPERLATMRCDLAGALVAAYLPGEARALLGLAVPELECARALGVLAEARLLLSELELQTGDAYRAARTAARACTELEEQDRDAWTPLATSVALRARLAIRGPDPALLPALINCADRLTLPFPTAAEALRLTASEVALEAGRHDLADALLKPLVTGPGVAGRHAEAMTRALRGDQEGALRAVARGLADVGASVAALTDPMTRAHAVKAGERLAAFGLSVAIGTGHAGTALAWAERWRAVVRTGVPSCPGLGALRAALGGARLVEYMGHGDRLTAVVVSRTEVTMHPLGPARRAAEAGLRLRYGLRRAACRDGAGSVKREAAAVQAELIAPLAGRLGDGPLVIVPTGPLYPLPWPALPALAGRPVCVAASAAGWLAGDRTSAARQAAGGVVAVAGPGLVHARTEAAMVTARHPGARWVPARAAAVLAALDGATLAHLATHGTFHAHSPLMSGLVLDDGPLMAYDLLGLRRPPRLVVLSACEAGMAHAPTDGGPLGLAGALLSRGTACVVACVVPVRDEEALILMTAFHDLLAAGGTPARALATAASATGVRGFACFGAGHRPLGSGSQPVAIGRSGEVIQSDHEPM